MLSVKLVYDEATKDWVPEHLKVNPIFEFFNESNPKEIKKAWKYKSAAGARQLPFIGIFEDNSIIKAFYAEDKSSLNLDSMYNWIQDYFNEHSYKGNIRITKLEGTSQEGISKSHEGYTGCFTEGVSLRILNEDRYYHTSIVTSIDKDAKTFKTLNSVYSYEYLD